MKQACTCEAQRPCTPARQMKTLDSLSAHLQAAAAQVPREAGTQPGEWPGIYACDHTKLLSIYGDTLRAGLAALKGDLAAAEVTVDPRSKFNTQLACSDACVRVWLR